MAGATPPATVATVDFKRYSGLWYEIARLPNRFQDQCAGNVTAEYQPREDGNINVINRCLTHDGQQDEATGLARRVDESDSAKLEVSFVRFLGWRLFWGDYWVIALDGGKDRTSSDPSPSQYQYAVIGHPERQYGWVLSRSATITNTLRNQIDQQLVEQGYNPADFKNTRQGLDTTTADDR